MLRMKRSDLTYEILQEIVKLYDETVGGHGSRYVNPWTLKDLEERNLQGRNAIEWRFGSKVTGHSKLWIHFEVPGAPAEERVYFRFGPNTSQGENEKLGRQLIKKFEKVIDKFLKERGLAVTEK